MRSNTDLTTVVITCKISPDKTALAREEFSAIIKTVVNNEFACHGIDLHVDQDDPSRLLLIEHWESKEVFLGAHMQTSHMQEFLQRAQGFLAAPPDFGFWNLLSAAA